MRYGVIGTGAVGGYYGGRLTNGDKDVHFLFHSDYDYVREHGLQVNSCLGSFHLDNINAYHTTTEMPPCDVVLVGLKSVNEPLLKTLLPPLLKEDTLVVLIQNGIGLEEDVEQMFPGIKLAAGLAFICSSKTKPGVIDHMDFGSINIGNYSCNDQAKMDQLMIDLADSGVEARLMEYNEARWRKAVWNMPFNGMTVALDTHTDVLLNNPDTETLIRDMMIEVIDAAQALGVSRLTHDFADKMIADTKAMTPYSPSMKLDYDFHRPMEIYYLYTRAIETAARAGFDMTHMRMLEAQLKFKQCTNIPLSKQN